jgi:hypothetical protein
MNTGGLYCKVKEECSMPLEIAEYSVNTQTGEEHRLVLRTIEAGEGEAIFNLGEVTGIYEELVLSSDEKDSWFIRGGGGTVHLSDPREVQFLVEPPALNVMQVRGEVLFYGSSERVVSIRRIHDQGQMVGETGEEAAFGGIGDEAYRHSLEQLDEATLVRLQAEFDSSVSIE